MHRTTILLAALSLALIASPGIVVAAPAADVRSAAVGQSPVAGASSTGERIELVHLRDETTRVFAEPSGLHTMEQYAEPVRARKGSGWAAIDTELSFGPDGMVRPGVTVAPLILSGGGSGARLVTLGQKNRQVTMGWSGRLPRPVLSGDTASYREVLPGVDLLLRAEPAGFAQVLVVKNRKAALNPALRTLRFPIQAAGLAVSTAADGTTVAKDDSGRVVFSAGSAVMWDSPSEDAAAAEKTAARRSGAQSARHATIPTTKSGSELLVRPDPELLTGAATRFPLYIDPSWAGVDYRWTHVNRLYPNQSYWNYDRAQGPKVGYAWDQSGNMYRSLFQMETAPIHGSRVIGARFDIVLDHSPSGTATPVDLWQTAAIDPAVPLTWNNSGGHWLAFLAQASGNAWTGGGQPNQAMGFASGPLTSLMQAVADQRSPVIGFGLRAANEGNRYQWKYFVPGTARIVVTFNNGPRMPIKVNLTRPRPCGTATAPTVIGSTQPQFSAVASDPDGDNIVTRLSIHRAADDVAEYELDSAATTSGAAFAWPQVPAGELTGGTTYYYVARSNDNVAGDGIEFGPASARCYFTVDTVRPGTPRLTSTDWPDGDIGRPVGRTGVVTLRPAAGDTDVAEYVYGFQQDKVTSRIKASPDQSAQVPITVWPDASGVPAKRLYVKAVDRAGNVSPSTQAWDLSADGQSPPVQYRRGDVNGDGRADVTAVLDHGFGRTAVWNVIANAGGLHTGTIAFDTGDNGGFALYRSRAVQGDFDGDGRADIGLFREEAGRRIALYLLKSDGNRYDAASSPVWHSGTSGWALSASRIVTGDVDGDRKSDIAVQLGNGDGTWRTLVFRGGALSDPQTWLQTVAGQGDWAQSAPLLADIDGDNRDDLVSMKNLGACRTTTEMFRSTGSAFAGTPVALHDSGAGTYCWERSKPAVADVDGDGRDDIVASYEHAQTDLALNVFRSTGSALTLTQGWRDTGRFDPARTALSVGDLTGDGKDDVALVHSLDGGGREVWTVPSTGSAFGPATLGWRETAVGASTGPKFDIEERSYELVNRGSGRCLEVFNASQNDSERFQQYDCFGGLHQRFRLAEVAGTEQFEVRTVHANGVKVDGKARCLNVGAQQTGDNTPVVQSPCIGTGNQQLTVEYVEGSSYDTVVRLKFAHSAKCAAAQGGGLGNSVPIVQDSCTANANQQWILRPALNAVQLDNRYLIRSVNGGRVVDVANCVNADGADMRLWDAVPGSPCQRWQIKPLGDDVYQIVDPSSGKTIDVPGCPGSAGTAVHLWSLGDSPCQRWRIEPAIAGSWSILQLTGGRSLDVAGCSSALGADLLTWPYWNGSCQRWTLG
ncbi:RICIN domain-containing protein [Kribbella sp. NPDC056861]|uniref:RICIN domain-containing protein n=1 Tax=Kribbella sp. NPDC056861 TaxID=3154857 RepID=UPI00341943FE